MSAGWRVWVALGGVSLAWLGEPFGAGALAAARVEAAFPATTDVELVSLGAAPHVDLEQWLARFGFAAPQRLSVDEVEFASTWSRLVFKAGRREMTFNGLRLFLGDALAVGPEGRLLLHRTDAETLIGPLLRPSLYAAQRREMRTVVIDAGHGGIDTGTRHAGKKLNEKDLALDTAKRLAALLEREGVRVVMTRTDDTFVSLAERAARANAAGADLFISVHFNAVAAGSAVHGTETYILTPAGQRSTGSNVIAALDAAESAPQPGNAHDAWNTVLGWQMHRTLLEELGTADRGLKRARFAVLRLVECPAVLVEAGYLSNDAEARRIGTAEYRQRIAEGIATGIARYEAQVRAAVAR